MNDTQYVCQRDFNEFREKFVAFSAANEERQKSIDHKLTELVEAKKQGVEHDSAQAQLITDLNNTVRSQGEQIGALRESRDSIREQLTKQNVEIENMKTEKRTLNWVSGIGISVALIASPLISEFIGNWLTRGQ